MTGLTMVVDDAALQRALGRLEGRVSHAAPLLETIGSVLESRVQQRFDFKRDPSGKQWASWKPSTAQRRAKEGRGELLWHGGPKSQHLRESLSYRVTDNAVVIGFGADYAIYHEFGTKHMARRGLLTANPQTGSLGADDRAAVLSVTQQYLEELL
jgi:phage virion morphogenesis protein